MFVYAVTHETIKKILKNKRIEKLRLTDYNTEHALVSLQKWGDVGQFTPPIEALYFEKDEKLPLNYIISHRNRAIRRGIYYVVVSQKTADQHGITLKSV